MQDNNIDEKILKKIEQLKPIVPLTNEFVEYLSGQLRLKAFALQTKKQSSFYQRWYFWTGALVPITLLVLMIIANQDGFVYKQLPLINSTVQVEKAVLDKELLDKKVELNLDTANVQESVSMFNLEQDQGSASSAPAARALPLIVDDNNLAVPENNTIQPLVLDVGEPSLLFKSEPVNPVLPKSVTQPDIKLTKKFILNKKLPEIKEKVSVYKVERVIDSAVIDNLYNFMNVKKDNNEQLNNDLVLVNNQLFGLKAGVDVKNGYIKFSKNEDKWRIRFLKKIMAPKEINEAEAQVIATDFIKSLGYDLENLSSPQITKGKENWRVDYYQEVDGLTVEGLSDGRRPAVVIEVDPLLAKVSSADVYWFNFQSSDYESLNDQEKLEKIISAGGYNLSNSTYIDQQLGEAKIIMLKVDNLLVPSFVFHLGQDNLYVPLIKEMW